MSASRRLRTTRVAAVMVASSLFAAGHAQATYPGSNNGRLAFGMNVGGNTDIYSVLPNGNDLRRLTHDPRFARYAQRTIHLFDGRVVEEETGIQREIESRELKRSGFEVV